MQAIIQARLDALSPSARELASAAAVIGRAFTVDVLAQVSGSDENALVQGLDELWQHRIIQEKSAGLSTETYDFSHDKIREVAYKNLSPFRRRHWHRRQRADIGTSLRPRAGRSAGPDRNPL